MLTSFERSNINKRLSVLKIIFNIEDSIVKIIKEYFSTNKTKIIDVINNDVSEEEFLKLLKYRANANKSLAKTYTNTTIDIYSFLEASTMGDLISILYFFKPGLKRRIAPKKWNFKQTCILLDQITKLRNNVSHSSLKSVDDQIHALPTVSKHIIHSENNRKKQYTIVLNEFAKHYELGVKNISL